MKRSAKPPIFAIAILTVGLNIVFMVIKVLAGLVGNSYALVADGIESGADIFTSFVTWTGLILSLRPPDDNHPFGHGKIESLAGMFAGASLLTAAGVIAWQSLQEIRAPHGSPEWYTLPVLIAVVAGKGLFYRFLQKKGAQTGSRAIEGEAGHQFSDAVTSGAAAIGISIALLGGDRYAAADDVAALIACIVIVFTGIRVLNKSLHDVLDGNVDETLAEHVACLALDTKGVTGIETCLIRKSGIGFFVELHAEVNPEITVREGHDIAHLAKDNLLSAIPELLNVTVHIEPAEASDPK